MMNMEIGDSKPFRKIEVDQWTKAKLREVIENAALASGLQGIHLQVHKTIMRCETGSELYQSFG